MIIVMGLPGAGKTTVLSGLKGYDIVNYGSMMLEIAKEKFGIEDRDKIRKQPIEIQKEIQRMVAEKLGKMDKEKKGRLVLDTHCSILTPNGYLPGLPLNLLEIMHKEWGVKLLVYITAKTEEIVERRSKDKSRERKADPKEIEEHENMNRNYLSVYSAYVGAPAKIIYNRNGGLEKAQKEIQEAVDSVIKANEEH